LARAAKREGFETLYLPFLGEWDPVSAWRLRRAAARARHRPILHAHTAHAAALAYLASLWGGPKRLVHRRVDFHLNGSLSRRFKYDSSPKIAAVSAEIRRVLAEDGVDPSRIAVVHDMIPWGEACPFGPASPFERAAIRRELGERLAIDPEAPWIGNMAAHVPHKDQATLLRAAAVLGRSRPDLKFLLVGDGSEHERLKALAHELNIDALVRFPGGTADPRTWLQAFDCYAHSSWGEGMGSVLLEAAATGVPIVATTAGGIPEVVEDGVSARLVAPRDPEALARAILQSIEEPQRSASLAAAAKADLRRFSPETIGAQTETLYREVAGCA
jgi:glycosyltransferase involved in cell wall biosynthesis